VAKGFETQVYGINPLWVIFFSKLRYFLNVDRIGIFFPDKTSNAKLQILKDTLVLYTMNGTDTL
jgi:hypothetical protein